MASETKSNHAKGRKQRPRLLVVNNPSPEDGSSDEERVEIGASQNYTTITTHNYPYPRPLPSPSQAASRGERSQPSSSHIPTPLTTNLPEHRQYYPSSRSNPSNPALSSPSSTSSPAVESTPPPSTPGQSAPPVDLSGDSRQDTVTLSATDRSDNTLPGASRSAKLLDKFKSHLPRSAHVRRSSNNSRPPSSPTTTTPDSYAPPSNHVLRSNTTERVILFVTADAENFITVDITGAMTPAFIRERIFTKLQIPDEEQSRFSIYRTEIGTYAIGDALTDEQLFDLYRDQGDSKATLKLFVSYSSAPVHEPSQDLPLASPSRHTLPPPVLPQHTLFAPLQPIRRSRSRNDSQSSAASERLPTETAAGYEASVSDDLDNEMRRATLRPLPQTRLPAPPHPPASPASSLFPQSLPAALSPDRPREQNHEASTTRPDMHTHMAVPTSPPHPLSPQHTKIHDRPQPIPPSQRDPATGLSGDSRIERENVSQAPETQPAHLEKPRRSAVERTERDERDRDRQERERPKRREGLRRQAGYHHSIHDSPEAKTLEEMWTVVSSDIPSSEYKNRKGRPTTPQDSRSPSSRYQGTGFGSFGVHSPPRSSPGGAGSGESRSKRTMKQVPANWAISWKGPVNPGKADPKPLQSPPSQPWPRMLGAKSMNDLRGAFKHPPSLQPGRPKPSQPSLPLVSRPSTGGSAASTGSEFTSSVSSASETMSTVSQEHMHADVATPRSYEPQRTIMSPTAYPSSRSAVSPGYSSTQPSALGHLGFMSPQEPYQRPRSAVDDLAPSYRPRAVHSPPRGPEGPSDNVLTRPTRPLYSGSLLQGVSSLPPGTVVREDVLLASSSRPSPSHRGEQAETPAVGSDPLYYSRHPCTPPHNVSGLSSAHPDSLVHNGNLSPSPAFNPKSCADRLTIEEDDSAEVTTLRPEDHPWSGFIDENAAEGTGTARQRRHVTQTVPTTDVPTSNTSGSSNWTGPTLIETARPEDESDSDPDEGTIWAKPPKRAGESMEDSLKKYVSPEKTRNAARPPLPPLSIEGSPSSSATILPGTISFQDPKAPPANFPGPPNFIPPPPPLPLRPTRRPSTKSGSSRQRRDQRTSRFDDNFDYTWAPRPPPEDVYERLEEYFPEHDLDQPVIETPSGGTSPTATELPAPQRFRHKKSIRVVAAEHKKLIDRTSRAEATSASVALRKRNTKLWGSKLEEVTTEQASTIVPTADASPGGALKPIFRWVRGELIGKGTYGKVYLALNATTGEMIAVKQVEIPRTASDKNDTRQVSVVEALKLESETLKDLDHANIVQYLGFEETPTFLSIFLEYVPGGSIGSCLRKHGKFDEEVTKSFTEQILAGLEYLHSRGILHRDMKADNILVETSGVCKISDFGISKRTDDIEMAGAYTSMQGTVFWMAPEVINSQKQGYNSKIDIWSVGCVVFEMWTGQRPWNGQEAMAVLLHLYQTKQGPSLPADVVLSPLADDFRAKCFAMDPDERPSAAELRRHSYLELQPGWQFNGFK